MNKLLEHLIEALPDCSILGAFCVGHALEEVRSDLVERHRAPAHMHNCWSIGCCCGQRLLLDGGGGSRWRRGARADAASGRQSSGGRRRRRVRVRVGATCRRRLRRARDDRFVGGAAHLEAELREADSEARLEMLDGRGHCVAQVHADRGRSSCFLSVAIHFRVAHVRWRITERRDRIRVWYRNTLV